MKVKLAFPWFSPTTKTGSSLNSKSGHLIPAGIHVLEDGWRHMMPKTTVFLDPKPEPKPEPVKPVAAKPVKK